MIRILVLSSLLKFVSAVSTTRSVIMPASASRVIVGSLADDISTPVPALAALMSDVYSAMDVTYPNLTSTSVSCSVVNTPDHAACERTCRSILTNSSFVLDIVGPVDAPTAACAAPYDVTVELATWFGRATSKSIRVFNANGYQNPLMHLSPSKSAFDAVREPAALAYAAALWTHAPWLWLFEVFCFVASNAALVCFLVVRLISWLRHCARHRPQYEVSIGTVSCAWDKSSGKSLATVTVKRSITRPTHTDKLENIPFLDFDSMSQDTSNTWILTNPSLIL